MQTTTGTQKIVWAVIGLVAIVGAVILFQKGGPVEAPLEQATNTEQKGETVTGETPAKEVPVATSEVSTKASFKDLLGKAGAQKCSVSQSSDISKSTGTFYFSGGKGRGTFESTVLSGPGAGVTSKNSMIMEGETIHVWDETTKQGMTLSLAGTAGAGGAAPANPMAEQFNQAYDYDCESWKADASMFVRPSDVTFMDMSEMMKSLPAF
jgi:hypothetical protein